MSIIDVGLIICSVTLALIKSLSDSVFVPQTISEQLLQRGAKWDTCRACSQRLRSFYENLGKSQPHRSRPCRGTAVPSLPTIRSSSSVSWPGYASAMPGSSDNVLKMQPPPRDVRNVPLRSQDADRNGQHPGRCKVFSLRLLQCLISRKILFWMTPGSIQVCNTYRILVQGRLYLCPHAEYLYR